MFKIIHFKKTIVLVIISLILTAPQQSQALEEQENAIALFPNSNLTQDAQELILKTAIKNNYYEFGFAGNNGSVCKAWDKFLNEKRYISPLYKSTIVNLQILCLDEIFHNGELIYLPSSDSDEGIIQLKISNLENPLAGTFDLSKCGNTQENLVISTGFHPQEITENKMIIWIVSRKFIKEELEKGRATQFKMIFPQWKPNSPIGIFWSFGGCSIHEHINIIAIADNLTLLSSKNLYDHNNEIFSCFKNTNQNALRQFSCSF